MTRLIAYLIPGFKTPLEKIAKTLEHMGADALFAFADINASILANTVRVIRAHMRPRRMHYVNAAKAIKTIVAMYRGDIVVLNAEIYVPEIKQINFPPDKIVMVKIPESARLEMPMWIPSSRYMDVVEVLKQYSGGMHLSEYIAKRIKDIEIYMPRYATVRGYALIEGVEVYQEE